MVWSRSAPRRGSARWCRRERRYRQALTATWAWSSCASETCWLVERLVADVLRNGANGGISSAAHSTLITDGPSTFSEARTAEASSVVSLTSTDDSLGNIAARPAPRLLGENRL